MFIKVKSYELSVRGLKLAYVILKINPLSMKLKAQITLIDGRDYVLLSNGQTNDEFEESVSKFVQDKFR